MQKLKNNIILLLYTAIIGTITGLIIWGFLKLNSLLITFLWEYLPSQASIPFYTVIVCTLGGLLIGLWKHKFGNYPEDLNDVIGKVKKTGRYQYKNIFSCSVSALAPLVIGASVGPEAGLAGIIAGLCTWVGDKLKHFFREVRELTNIGITATLGTIFRSPMFGFMEPLESEEETKLPKTSKIILYFTAIMSAFGIFILFNNLFGKMAGFESVGYVMLENVNWFMVILVGLVGIAAGYFYYYSHKIVSFLFGLLGKHIILKCLIGGLALGLIGYFLPLTMFSGEEQIGIVFETGAIIGATTLILVGAIKIILTNVCIESGLKGGHFFPMIFAGIAIGYGLSILLNLDPVIASATLTTAFLANILKKPLATVLLLMIVFPVKLLPIMLVAAIVGALFKTPNERSEASKH